MRTTAPAALTADEIVARKQDADKLFDQVVKRRFLEIAAHAGVVTDEGELDRHAVADRAYEVLKTKRVVDIRTDKDDRRDPATSSCREELAEAIFTTIPTGPEADLNRVEEKVRMKCLNAIWDVCQTGGRGLVQKMLDGDGLILIRGKVWRNSITVHDGLYVSTHEEVVLREFLEPRLEKLRKIAEALKGDYEMATGRVGELSAPMQAAIEKAMVEATAKLPVTTLTTGASHGQTALGR